MIERVVAADGNAGSPDPVRSARLIGDSGTAEATTPLEMKDLLQRLAELSREPADKQPNMTGGADSELTQRLSQRGQSLEQPSALESWPVVSNGASQPTSEETGTASTAAPPPLAATDDQLPLDQFSSLALDYAERVDPVDVQRRQWPAADANAASAVGQLEQVEQWLAELQRLEAQHGGLAPDQPIGDSLVLTGLLPAQERPSPEARRLTQSMASFAVSSQDVLVSRTGFTPAPVSAELVQQGSTGQFETVLLASLADESGLQSATNRVAESAAGTVPNSLMQQLAGTAPTPAEVRLHGPEARWGEQMLQALRDQVQTQIAQRSQHATIRLDPPELGSLDIQISHEQGKLSVQINAGQADIARLLTMLGERLRHELLSQNFSEVSVEVGSHSEQGRDGRQRHASAAGDEPIAGAKDSQQRGSGNARDPSSDILITV